MILFIKGSVFINTNILSSVIQNVHDECFSDENILTDSCGEIRDDISRLLFEIQSFRCSIRFKIRTRTYIIRIPTSLAVIPFYHVQPKEINLLCIMLTKAELSNSVKRVHTWPTIYSLLL